MKTPPRLVAILLAAACAMPPAAFAQFDLTSPTGGSITYCSSHASYPGTKAFDDGGSVDPSRWLADASQLPNAWVQYVFPSETVVAGYKVFGFSSGNNGLIRDPRDWTFEGSNDGSTWTELDTQASQTGWASLESRAFYFDNETAFTHYRFTITANNGASDYTGVLELEFYPSPNTPGVPVVSAGAATPTLATRATLNALLSLGGTSDFSFHWGVAPGVWTDSKTIEDASPVAVSADIAGLDLFRTYYWTVSAENSHGSAWAPTTNSFVSLIGSDISRPDGLIAGCDSLSPYLPANAFDDNATTDAGRWLPRATNMPNAWVEYSAAEGPYFLRAYAVTGLRSSSFATRTAKAWTLSGSTNGVDWTTLDAQGDQTTWGEGERRIFLIDPSESYSSFRFTISENNGATDYTGVQELEFFGFPNFSAPPSVASQGVAQLSSGEALLMGTLTAGFPAEVSAAWGTSPDALTQTNTLGTVYNDVFQIPATGLTPFETYYYTIFAINGEGFAEVEGAPLIFIAEGERFTWIGPNGDWEDALMWSQGERTPNLPGDQVLIDTIRTIALNDASATIGALTLSGPYAQGSVVITNATPEALLVFDNPGGAAFIDADAGGAAPYLLYPDLVLNEDVVVTGTESWPVYLRGGVSGPGRLLQQSGAHIRLAPVVDTVYENVFAAQGPTAYLHIGDSAHVTLRGTNTVSFYGNWSANSTLKSHARLVLDGGITTNLSGSTRASVTYYDIVGASLVLTNGAQLVNPSSALATYAFGSGNQFAVTGPGSTWAFNTTPFRDAGTSNRYEVANGATIENAPFNARGNSAVIRVVGDGTTWNAAGRFCIGRSSNGNQAEVSDGAIVSNCVLFVAGRYGYDDGSIGGGSDNILTISGGAKILSTRNDTLTDGAGVGITGNAGLMTFNNSLRVTGAGSTLDLGNVNFNIGYMQKAAATGGWNRVSVADSGLFTNAANLAIGRLDGDTTQSWSNSLHAASGGEVRVNNAIAVGDDRSTGNRIVMAGGLIAAKTLAVKTGNGIGAELGLDAPVPATFETSATFEAGTYVWPELAEGVRDGVGGVILTAPTIVDGGLELSPDADPALWHLVTTDTTIALYHHPPTTLMIVR